MSRVGTGITTALSLTGPAPITTWPFHAGCWVKLNSATYQRFITLGLSGSNHNYHSLGLDYNGTSAVAMATDGGTSAGEALSTSPISSGAWVFVSGSVASAILRAAQEAGANAGTDNTNESPTGINQLQVSGYAPGAGYYLNGEIAHIMLFTRVLAAIELGYLAGGGNPRQLATLNYFNQLNSNASPEVPEVGTGSLTVNGMTYSSDMPPLATYFTGSAIANQSFTQGAAITPVTPGFKNVGSAFTVELALLGGAGTATTTSAAGTSSTQVPLTSASGYSAGGYLQIGSNAYALILAISGTTALIQGAQTWTNGATVTYYPVTTPTIAGLSIVSGGLAGTPSGTQAATPNYFFRTTNNTTSSLVADSNLFSITVTSGVTAPAFSQNPAVTQQNPDGYVVSVVPNSACTAYLAAYLPGATAPNATQLMAGTGAVTLTGGSPAVVSAALTGSGSLTLAGLQYCQHDLYLVLHNTNGSSAVFPLTGQLRAPIAGCQLRPITTTIAANSPLFGVASIGDIEETGDPLTPDGIAETLRGDGSDAWSGPSPSGRQVRQSRVQSITYGGWLLTSAGSQWMPVYYNDTVPVGVGGSPVINLVVGQTVNIPLAPYFITPYTDVPTISATPTAAGTTVSSNALVGTATTPGTTAMVVTFIDIAGESATQTISVVVSSSSVQPGPPILNTVIPLSPGLINRTSAVVVDMDHTFGGDLTPSNSGDVATVSGLEMGQQKIIRRLATNQGGYITQPTYGAGLPGKIGNNSDPQAVQGLVESQTLLEPSVAPNPRPVATVTPTPNDPDGLGVNIQYTDVPSKATTTLGFNISSTPNT